MASGAAPSFLRLSNESNNDIFQDNRPSKFTVQLGQQLVLDPQMWEVGLSTITYPYDFDNMGDESIIGIRYESTEHVLKLPSRNCIELEDLCEFLSEEINAHLFRLIDKRVISTTADRDKRSTNNQYVTITFNKMRHVTFTFKSKYFDIGFSPRLQEMLGFETQPQYSLAAFNERKLVFESMKTIFRKLDFNIPLEALEVAHQKILKEKHYDTSIDFYKYIRQLSQGHPMPSTEYEFEYMLKNHVRYSHFINQIEDIQNIHKNNRLHLVPGNDPPDIETYKKSIVWTFAFTLLVTLDFLDTFRHEVLDIQAEKTAISNPYEMMYIYTDIIRPQPFNEFAMPILDILKTEGTPGHLTQYRASGNIQYHSLDRANITNIKILIAGHDGKEIPFLRGPLVITLHFRRKASGRFH